MYLSDLMRPTEAEKQFMEEFRHKRYRPELLFEDEEIVGRLLNHPMALWKMQQQRKGMSLTISIDLI